MKHCLPVCALLVLVGSPLSRAGDGELWASRLLQVTMQHDNPEAMREVAIAFAKVLPEGEQRPSALVPKAIDGGYWASVIPGAKRGAAAFGVDYVYGLEDEQSALASLARLVVLGLSSSTVDQRLAMARALREAFPEQDVFRYLQEGIQAAVDENSQYAFTRVRGEQLIRHLEPRIEQLETHLQTPGQMTGAEYRAASERLADHKRKLEEARELVRQGQQYQPLSESLLELGRQLLVTIDELEAIGDL